MNRVLITGASGFIGRHIAYEFYKNGWQVTGIGHGNWLNWRDYGLNKWITSDITLESLIEFSDSPNVIVHCAGGSSVGFSIEKPATDFNLTVDSTSGVLEFIRLHSPSTTLVYPSSAAVYGQVKSFPISEDIDLNPVSPYGVHKQMSESLCQLYSRQYGLSIAIVRMFSIYGSELRKQLLWDACQKIERNDCDYFGTGEEIRDWLHVKDVSKLLFISSQNTSENCPIINAGYGDGVKVKNILHFLNEKFNIRTIPKFSSKVKIGDPNAYIADISRARCWGWNPSITWKDGVAQYVDWYKKCK